MASADSVNAYASEAKRILWPGSEETPDTPRARDAVFLRMYPPGKTPQAGSLRSDHVDMDSHWHFHDMHQLFFAFEGAVEVESEDGRHLISQQLAAWIPANVAHRASLHQVPSVSIFFTTEMLPQAGSRIRSVMVSPLMREMMREATRWPLHGPASPLRNTFFAAMAGLCDEWIEQQEVGLFLPASTDPRLRRALEYTANRMDARLADVCHAAGLSERTLRRHLRAETGLTWETYRQRSRLLRAMSLLSESSEQIADIAAHCGFESPSAFAKAFRAATGESPRTYRMQAYTK
jgi:AraC-like DNA-binding protein